MTTRVGDLMRAEYALMSAALSYADRVRQKVSHDIRDPRIAQNPELCGLIVAAYDFERLAGVVR